MRFLPHPCMYWHWQPAPPGRSDIRLRNCSSASDRLAAMFRISSRMIALVIAGLCLAGALLSQIPAVKSRLDWRYEVWSTYVKNVIDPVGPMPTPVPSTPFATFTPGAATPTVPATAGADRDRASAPAAGFTSFAEIRTAGHQQLRSGHIGHDAEHVWVAGKPG